MGLYDFTFYDLIERNSADFGDRTCWRDIEGDRQLSFKQYREKVDSLAAGLGRSGIVKGDRIGVLGKNSLEFFLIYGAAARLGAIVLPVNWRLSAEEVCFNLSDCEPKVLFLDAEFQDAIVPLRNELPTVHAFFNLADDAGSCTSFLSLFDTPHEGREDVSMNDGFIIIHTAAVAGRPRGGLLSHGNLLHANQQFQQSMLMSAKDVHLNLLPLFHVAGLFMAAATFHAGGVNLNMNRFDGETAAEWIEKCGVTHFFEFPPILDTILTAAEKTGSDLSSLRAVIGLGTPEVIDAFHKKTGGDYFVMYGQTETSCLATIGRYRDRPGSAGQPITLGQVQLVDDYDRPVAQGKVGEICLRGPMVFLGYWGLEKDNEYTFREGWHHTGDLGRFDEDGYLFYAGRKSEKELIKPGGENVYPAEVEKVVMLHPAVEKTAVIGVPDPKWKEGIKAVVQLKEGMELEPAELIAFVGEKIARFKKPQYVDVIESMPLDQDGNIDRQEVKKLYG